MQEATRLPRTYIDAKELISSTLESGKVIAFSKYRQIHSSTCTVKNFYISEPFDGQEEGYANFDLTLNYEVHKIVNNSEFRTIEKTKIFRVLSPIGDSKWNNQNIIIKVWNGNYPSTVAVDTETGEVYFMYIYFNRIEFVYFGFMTDEELETFSFEINDREPFQIFINHNTMFQVLSDLEGVNALQRGVTVTFNCGSPITIYNQDKKVDVRY